MGLVNFAFEEGDIDEVVADAPMAEVVEVAADATADAGEIAQVQEMVDTGIAEAGNMETVADAVADTLEEGGEGLSPDAATQVEISVESICARVGMKNTSKLSVESFKSTASRRQATKLSLEGIWDKLKKIWEAIKKTLANLWERIKLWFGKMNLVAVATGKSAVDLITKLNAKKNGKKEKATLALKSVSAAFSVGGKCGVKEVESILKASGDQISAMHAFIGEIGSGAHGLSAGVTEFVKSAIAGNSPSKDLPSMQASVTKLQSSLGTAKFVRGITGKVVSEFKDKKMSAKFEIQIPAKFEPAAEVSVCSIQDAISMANSIRQVSVMIKEASVFDALIGKYTKTANEAIEDLSKLIDSSAKKEIANATDKAAAAEAVGGAQQLVNVAFSYAQNQLTVVSSLASSVSTKILDYAKNAVTEALVYGYAVEAQYKDAE